jgi:GT2 family glycosyltransferase
MTVAAVVVTRDRRALLRDCLAAIAAQTRPADRLVVVDNASSDGTPEMLRAEHPEAEVVALTENVGSSGGFAAGVEAAAATGAAWLWLLDDDTVARPDTLERLLAAPWREAGLPEPSLLCSRVDWTDGRPHPMNRGIVRRRDPQGYVAAARAGLVPMRAMTFVSLLVDARAVAEHGPPRADFFLQADDIEFTARILRRGHGYLVPDSVVEHRTPSARDFISDEFRFYFHLRNTLAMLRGGAWDAGEKASLGWTALDTSALFLRRHGRDGAAVIGRAVRDAARMSRTRSRSRRRPPASSAAIARPRGAPPTARAVLSGTTKPAPSPTTRAVQAKPSAASRGRPSATAAGRTSTDAAEVARTCATRCAAVCSATSGCPCGSSGTWAGCTAPSSPRTALDSSAGATSSRRSAASTSAASAPGSGSAVPSSTQTQSTGPASSGGRVCAASAASSAGDDALTTATLTGRAAPTRTRPCRPARTRRC